MTLEYLPYHLCHERLREAVEHKADRNTLLVLALDAEEALAAFQARLKGN